MKSDKIENFQAACCCSMAEPAFLPATLKSMLRERRISYSVLASELKLSLLTIKRTLNKPGVPLDRLLDICRIAKIEFVELVERAATAKPQHSFFDSAQDAPFTQCPPMLTYFEALQSGQSPPEIARKFQLTAASTRRYLLAIADVQLIRLNGSDRQPDVEILLDPPVGFSPGSTTLARLSIAFLDSIAKRMVAASELHDGDFSLLKPFHLSERQYHQLTGELYEVASRYAFFRKVRALMQMTMVVLRGSSRLRQHEQVRRMIRRPPFVISSQTK